MTNRTLPEMVQELPPDAQEVVRDLVEYLLSRSAAEHDPPTNRTLRQDWAGALRAYRGEYTAIDLQRRANDWRASS